MTGPIALVTLIGVFLAQAFDLISSRYSIASLFIWAGAVFILHVGETCWQRLQVKQPEPPRETFCCMHCAKRKPMEELSTAINRMCQGCADLYETIQDEV